MIWPNTGTNRDHNRMELMNERSRLFYGDLSKIAFKADIVGFIIVFGTFAIEYVSETVLSFGLMAPVIGFGVAATVLMANFWYGQRKQLAAWFEYDFHMMTLAGYHCYGRRGKLITEQDVVIYIERRTSADLSWLCS